MLQNKRKINMEENIKNPGRLQWWKEQQNDLSGRWLEVFPKINKYTFNSTQFRTNMRYRMMLPVLSHIPGSKRSCKVPNSNDHPTLDKYGVHQTAACNIYSCRQQIHDMVVMETQLMCQEAGFHTKREPKGIFSTSNHRPDIAINNAQKMPAKYTCEQLLLDIALPGPVNGSKSGILNQPADNAAALNLAGKQITKTYDGKKSKYEKLFEMKPTRSLNPNFTPRFKIVPIIIGLLGNVHKQTMEFFEQLAEYSDNIFRYGKNNILTYYKRRLSCCLFKNIANTLIRRVATCNSRFCERNSLEFELICD
jgi:hypothetical protein